MLKSIAQTAGTANLVEWAKLALKDVKAPVMRVTRTRHEHGQVALEEVVLPLSHFPGLIADGEAIPDIAELAQQYGLFLGRASERISFIPAPSGVAQHLGIAEGTGIVKLERITETTDGEPVEWRVAYVVKS
jgi:DNA-binding GntR family transcriptional regulator